MPTVAVDLARSSKVIRGLKPRKVVAEKAGVSKRVLNAIEHEKFYQARVEDVLKVINTLLEMPNLPEEQKKTLCTIYRKLKPRVAKTHRCYCHKYRRSVRR